jgi:hypothetical protein
MTGGPAPTPAPPLVDGAPAEVFVSYAREDAARVEAVVRALEARGLRVFWDRRIPAGSTWRDFIGQALAAARCVVVVWTRSSVESAWVVEEADAGKARGILVPLTLDPVAPPLGFRSIQTADLSAWDCRQPDGALERLVSDVDAVLRSSPRPARTAPPPAVPPRWRPWRWAVLAVALLLAAAFAVRWAARPPDVGAPPPGAGEAAITRSEPAAREATPAAVAPAAPEATRAAPAPANAPRVRPSDERPVPRIASRTERATEAAKRDAARPARAAKPTSAPERVAREAGRERAPTAAPPTGGAPGARGDEGAPAAPARSGCTAVRNTDGSVIRLVDDRGDVRADVPLGRDRVQRIFTAPDGSWAIAAYKVRGRDEYGVLPLDLANCAADDAVQAMAHPPERASFEGRVATLGFPGGGTRQIALDGVEGGARAAGVR